MQKLKAVFLAFFLYLPFGAHAVAPIVIALLAAAGAITGLSVYRSFVPVNLNQALEYFSGCWSCNMFSDILLNLSNFIPKIYSAVGLNILPIASALTLIWFVWRILSDYIQVRSETNPWKITGMLGTQFIKLSFIAILLVMPLPKFMMDTFIGPVMNIGLSLSGVARGNINEAGNTEFNQCLVDMTIDEKSSAKSQAYSPKLRHNLTCQIAEFHKLTGLGMATGWTFMNMAFSAKYAIKAWVVPIFPNLVVLLVGFALFLMFLWAMLPVPLYFLEVFIKLSMDLVMLPLLLLSWLFAGEWKITNLGSNSIKIIIDDAVKNTCGIAMVGLFTSFAVLFLSEVVGHVDGVSALVTAIQNNDSEFLMDSMMLSNKSLISLVLAGLFIGMFMNAIPNLIKMLFRNVSAVDTTKLQNAIVGHITNLTNIIKKKVAAVKDK